MTVIANCLGVLRENFLQRNMTTFGIWVMTSPFVKMGNHSNDWEQEVMMAMFVKMGNHVNDWEQEVMTAMFVKMGNHVNDWENEVMTS